MSDMYSDAELRRLWLQFADEPDAAQRLAGFAVCDVPTAREMIRRFNDSAATRRATEADRKRLADNTTTGQKAQKHKEKQSEDRPAAVEDDAISCLPPSDLLASLVNDIHGYSEIKAEGRTRTRAVIIERFGDGVFRLKRTQYRYFRSFDDALEAAKVDCLRLRTF